MTPTTAKPKPIGDQAAQALQERRKARELRETRPADAPIESRAIAARMRDRDHRDGCPASENQDAAVRVEAYAETIVAPGAELRSMGMAAGDTVVVVRCCECGNLRYFDKHRRQSVNAATEAFVDDSLASLAGQEPAPSDDGDLDETL